MADKFALKARYEELFRTVKSYVDEERDPGGFSGQLREAMEALKAADPFANVREGEELLKRA